MYSFFYLPYFYTYKTKLFKKGRWLSYFLFIALPPAYFAFVLQSSMTLLDIVYVVIGLVMTHNLYEIGYIQNDTETIKNELNPTLRLNQLELDFYTVNRRSIYIFRAGVDLALSLVLLYLSNASFNIYIFLGVVHFILPVFLVYNNIRNGWNLVLHFILSVLKYSAVQFLFCDKLSFSVLFLSIFAYPILNTIDRAATPRFFNKFSQFYIPRTAKFRAIYYLFFFVICTCLWKAELIDIYALLISAYYFIFRSMILLAKMK